MTRPTFMNESRFIQQLRSRVLIIVSACLPVLILSSGCQECLDGTYGFTVSGTFVDSESKEPLGNLGYVMTLRRNGEDVVYVAYAPGSDVGAPSADENGTFSLRAIEGRWGECRAIGVFPLDPFNIPEPTPPDEIEFRVGRPGCHHEQTIVVPIDEETVTDLSFPDDTIEFRAPIAVPPCE